MTESDAVEKKESTPAPDTKGARLFSRGIIACYIAAALLAIHAVVFFGGWITAVCILGLGVYFFLAPAKLREGAEKTRQMVGMLSVPVVLLSFRGVFALGSESEKFYGALSLGMLLCFGYLVRVFGYNQEVVSHQAAIRKKLQKSSESTET